MWGKGQDVLEMADTVQIQCIRCFSFFLFSSICMFFCVKKKNYANISCRNGETSRSVTMTT